MWIVSILYSIKEHDIAYCALNVVLVNIKENDIEYCALNVVLVNKGK